VVLDRANESVIGRHEPISLRHKEYAIFDYLIQNAGRTISRSKLVSQVWKDNKNLGRTLSMSTLKLRIR